MGNIEELLAIARECLQDEDISTSSVLEDARGHDSLTHVKFIMALEQHYGVNLEGAVIPASMTVQNVYGVIARQRGQA
jgi:acyl carrier protein